MPSETAARKGLTTQEIRTLLTKDPACIIKYPTTKPASTSEEVNFPVGSYSEPKLIPAAFVELLIQQENDERIEKQQETRNIRKIR